MEKYFVFGLGNPGDKYKSTRHNLGFMVVDFLADKYNQTFTKKKFESSYLSFNELNKNLFLVKPQTFMNLSGKAVADFVNFYSIKKENYLIVYDDYDLPFGEFRIKDKGSSGGHNGIKDIIKCLGTEDFCRLRIGIKNDEKTPILSFVTKNFNTDEFSKLDSVKEKAVLIVESIIKEGISASQQKFN